MRTVYASTAVLAVVCAIYDYLPYVCVCVRVYVGCDLYETAINRGNIIHYSIISYLTIDRVIYKYQLRQGPLFFIIRG